MSDERYRGYDIFSAHSTNSHTQHQLLFRFPKLFFSFFGLTLRDASMEMIRPLFRCCSLLCSGYNATKQSCRRLYSTICPPLRVRDYDSKFFFFRFLVLTLCNVPTEMIRPLFHCFLFVVTR